MTVAAGGRPAEDEADLAQRWTEARTGVQTTARWVITAFAAVGAVMFAKGFVTTPKLSWSDNRGQLVFAWILGAVGTLGIGWLISLISRLLLPTVFTIGTLPSKFEELVETAPEDYLPTDCKTIVEFRANLLRTRRGVDNAGRAARMCAKALADAKRQSPPDPVAVAAAEQNLEAVKDGLEKLTKNLELYSRRRKELLNRAEYWSQANAFRLNSFLVFLAASIAAVGGIGYQLALSAPDKAEDKSAGGTSTASAQDFPAVGELVRSDTDAGRDLWRQLGLKSCQPDPTAARIPLMVIAGRGVRIDPYRVATIPTGTCRPQSFTVVNEVAQLTVPKVVKITYSPSPPAGADD